MKILYLFNSPRTDVLRKVDSGEFPDTGFWGMLRLRHSGITTDFTEVEQAYPRWAARLLRKFVNIYFIHVPVFFKFFSYDYVFTSSAYGTQLVYTLLHIRRPRWVMHDFSITGLIGNRVTLRQRIFKWMTGRAAGIVTLSAREAVLLKGMFPHLKEKIRFIPFGTDLEFFSPKDRTEDVDVIAVGFDPDRDWKALFEAVEGLDVRVVVATRPQRLAGLTVPANVEVRQFTPRELVDAYARAKVVVIPLNTRSGINDAMGCSTLFEGMAMAKPVIATDTHTMASYVTPWENGVLVPEGDASAFKAAILELLEDTETRLRLGKNARVYAEAHLDSETCTTELAAYFTALAKTESS